MNTETTVQALVEAASAYYRAAGKFAWHFARGKLKADPAYRFILQEGLLRGCTRLIDLGAGQGLLAAWLLAAHSRHASEHNGAWPRGWPPPPLLASYTGIEINAQEVRRARRAFALDSAAHIRMLHADIAAGDYGQADAVVLLDVLHYNDFSAQEHILKCARAALAPGGLLLLRVGDAAGGHRVALSQAFDRTVALMRRGKWLRLHCRAGAEWQELLVRQGFVPRALSRVSAATFSNTLLLGEAA